MSKKYKVYNVREFRDLLKDNDYSFVRCKGDHEIWKHSRGRQIVISIIDFNPLVARRLIKEYELKDGLQKAIRDKFRILNQLAIFPSEQEKIKIRSATSINHLDRICRDIIDSRY